MKRNYIMQAYNDLTGYEREDGHRQVSTIALKDAMKTNYLVLHFNYLIGI